MSSANWRQYWIGRNVLSVVTKWYHFLDDGGTGFLFLDDWPNPRGKCWLYIIKTIIWHVIQYLVTSIAFRINTSLTMYNFPTWSYLCPPPPPPPPPPHPPHTHTHQHTHTRTLSSPPLLNHHHKKTISNKGIIDIRCSKIFVVRRRVSMISSLWWWKTSRIFAIRTLHDCPAQMNENLLISNSKLTSDSELIWWR